MPHSTSPDPSKKKRAKKMNPIARARKRAFPKSAIGNMVMLENGKSKSTTKSVIGEMMDDLATRLALRSANTSRMTPGKTRITERDVIAAVTDMCMEHGLTDYARDIVGDMNNKIKDYSNLLDVQRPKKPKTKTQ